MNITADLNYYVRPKISINMITNTPNIDMPVLLLPKLIIYRDTQYKYKYEHEHEHKHKYRHKYKHKHKYEHKYTYKYKYMYTYKYTYKFTH